MSVWTENDINYLLNNYSQVGKITCAEVLNRTPNAVRIKAKSLGIETGTWTKEEIEFLLEYYHLHGSEFCAKSLPKRSRQAVKSKALSLGLRFSGKQQYINNSHIEYLEWLNNNRPNIIPLENYVNSSTKILHKDQQCGHTWKVIPSNIKKGTNCPTCSRKGYSKIAIRWLNSLNIQTIKHAENGGEQVILGSRVDGYDPITNTIYEFHGDRYHGNLDIFAPEDNCHPFEKDKTAEELWQETYDRMERLSKVAEVIYIWENDYRNGKTFSRF